MRRRGRDVGTRWAPGAAGGLEVVKDAEVSPVEGVGAGGGHELLRQVPAVVGRRQLVPEAVPHARPPPQPRQRRPPRVDGGAAGAEEAEGVARALAVVEGRARELAREPAQRVRRRSL